MNPILLTLIIASTNTRSPAFTSVTQEYNNIISCMEAKSAMLKEIKASISIPVDVVATCTQK